LAVSALAAVTVTALGILVCGIHSFEIFLVNANTLRSSLLDHGGQNFWLSSPTPYAALRCAGVGIIPAYLAHAVVAVVSIWAACHVWRSTGDLRLRTSILFVAVPIVSPYVWHYELVWLGVALACVAASGLNARWLRGEQAVLAFGWLLPLYEHFNRLMKLPQIGSIVLLLTLLVTLRRVRVSAGARA
jgi:alpha-1,2-mannosyltransferase